ncbi:MAG: chitobiase/beta-hexosaminidase C-terminal domain-containing protein [Acidobacteriaceae bacterium]|nr:chitobiase/beta-hexosaminidase C-terminal domain-containing protein [Acidobacteriaceae bacterium]
MTDTTVISNTARAGLNIGTNPQQVDTKNLYYPVNPGFEPQSITQMLQFNTDSSSNSTTQFTVTGQNFQYNQYTNNEFTGADFIVVNGCYAGSANCTGGATSDPAYGCTGSIATNSKNGSGFPVFTINSTTNQGSNGCAGRLGTAGQVILLTSNYKMSTIFPTPGSVWTSSYGQNNNLLDIGFSGSATVGSNTTDLCSNCGQQSLSLTFSGSGSETLDTFALTQWYNAEKTRVVNGAYTTSFWAKAASGSPTISVIETDRAGTSCSKSFNLNSSWTQYSFSCTFAETASTPIGYGFHIAYYVNSPGASSVYMDNLNFSSNADTNPTVFTNEFVEAVQAWCQSTTNTTGQPCTLRYAPFSEGYTMANWTKPANTAAQIQFAALSVGQSWSGIQLYDFLQLCNYVGATPVLLVPIMTSTVNVPGTSFANDAANLMDYLEDNSGSTTYGAIRQAQGQTAAWVGSSGSPFSTIYLEMGNENWNAHIGFGLAWNPNSPTATGYYDYAVRAGEIISAAHARQSSQGYNTAPAKFVLNLFTATKGYDAVTALGISKADVGELNAYTAYNTGDVSTNGCLTPGSTNATCPLYGPVLTEPWANTHDPNAQSGFYGSVQTIQAAHVCGASGTATCQAMVYEENTSPTGSDTSSSGPFTQSVSDIFVQTGVQGVVTADQLGENDAAGIVNQNVFTSTQYSMGGNGVGLHMWGTMIDNGGDCSATNSSIFGGSYCPRPQMLGAQVYNWCKIGPMVQTSWTGNPTYNLPANNNGVNALTNVPVLRSFAFAQGGERCMVIVNSDVYSAHTVNFSGNNAPSKGVTTYQFAPPALASTNEASSGNFTGAVEATMWNTTTPGVDVSSGYTLPPHSVTAFLWTANGNNVPPTAATPTFSPAGGSYSSAQTVSISTSTSGATIHYTTDGSTPSASSAVYSGPLTVSSTETLQAIAVESGYSNSSVATAAYTINTSSSPAAKPTFSPAGGSYTSNQSVTIKDTTSGAKIYYTTDGTTPTTASTQYAGPITVASNQTINAIAASSGHSNSPVATAAYTITGTLPAPTFSVPGGTYSAAQTVTISDATAGTKIYYTTDGTPPSTSAALYKGAITVSSSETLEAIAVKTGYSNSNVAIAAYTINSSCYMCYAAATPTFSIAGGTYSGTQTVSIADATAGATIYYTTDGSTPTTSSTVYTGPVTVSSTQTVQAIAVETGYTNSGVASATYTISAGGSNPPAPVINFPSGFAGSSGEVVLGGSAKLSGSSVQLTGLNLDQAGAVWYTNPVNVQSFTTNFTFQITNPSADGFTFAIQNSSPSAVGGLGIDLGYGSIPHSMAVKFDLFNNAGEGTDSTGLYTNGARPTVPATDLTSSGVNLHSGDTMAVQLVYNGTTLTMTITDTVSKASFTTSWNVNIPAAVGGNTAYVGFTGGTGGLSAIQDIASWTYSPAVVATPTFSIAAGTYSGAQTVSISDATAGANIYYTTDGTTPTTSSTQYTGPITVNSTETIEAIAVNSGYIGSAVSSATYIIGTATPVVNFPSGFASSSGEVVLGGAAKLSGSSVQLTGATVNEAGAVWYANPVNVQSFTTNFTFQVTDPSADGFTFAIQNSSPSAVGGLGVNLGYGSIPHSVAVKFDLFNNAGEGTDSTGLYTNGATPTVPATDLTSSGVNLHSGNTMAAQVVYNGTTLTMTITDTVSKASFTTSWNVNIPAAVGANTAYVGFTGGTGGLSAIQDILSWSFAN